MQPSGPVPAVGAVASGSGPHDEKTPLRIPQNADEALRGWNLVLEALEKRNMFSVFAPFQHARVLKWTTDALDLGFPIDVHTMGEMAHDRVEDLKTLLRELGPEQKSVRVTVKLLDDGESKAAGARSILETTQDKSRAEKTKREAEAREHPITKHVLQTFGASIKEIKTDV
jgi:hypothetical protein